MDSRWVSGLFTSQSLALVDTSQAVSQTRSFYRAALVRSLEVRSLQRPRAGRSRTRLRLEYRDDWDWDDLFEGRRICERIPRRLRDCGLLHRYLWHTAKRHC